MIETFIAGTALALACFWMLKYGHIVVVGGLVVASVLAVYGLAMGTVAASTVYIGGFVVLLLTVFAVM